MNPAGRIETFDEAAKLQLIRPNEYTARVHPDWSFGTAAHGGNLGSIILKAVKLHFSDTLSSYNQRDTVFSHVEFLRPTSVGDVRIIIQDTKLSKVSSTVHVTIEQDGKARVVAYVTNTNRAIPGLSKNMELAREIQVPPIDFAAVLDNTDRSWIRWDVPYTVEASNKAVMNCIIAFPRVPGINDRHVHFWLRCLNPSERWTTEKLGIAADLFVPTVENFFPGSEYSTRAIIARAIRWSKHGHREQHAWDGTRFYPTINMSLDIKRSLPDTGVEWLFLQLESKELVNGRLDCSFVIWDQDYNLIALAHLISAGLDTSQVGETNKSFQGAANRSKI